MWNGGQINDVRGVRDEAPPNPIGAGRTREFHDTKS